MKNTFIRNLAALALVLAIVAGMQTPAFAKHHRRRRLAAKAAAAAAAAAAANTEAANTDAALAPTASLSNAMPLAASAAADNSVGDTNPGSGTITPATTTPLTFTGTATATGADSEADAIAGINKSTYVLTVAAGNYAGQQVSVAINWAVAANDRDLYVYLQNADGTDGTLVASSAGGAPQTGEQITFNPVNIGVTTLNSVALNVETVYFASTPNSDQPVGTINLITASPVRTASYTDETGVIAFSPNSACKAPVANSDGEPSSRVDVQGNAYVCGIEGVPAGVDLWYFDLRPTLPDPTDATKTIANPNYDPNMRLPIYRGKPDSAVNSVGVFDADAGGLGGGDIDLSVGFSNYPGDNTIAGNVTAVTPAQSNPVLSYASLTAANVTVGRSLDLGATYQFNGLGNAVGGVAVNDRQWMGTFGPNLVFLEYRNFAEGVAFAQLSSDGGLTYGPASEVGLLPQTGALDVDEFDGTVYISGNDGTVVHGIPTTPGQLPLDSTLALANSFSAPVQATPVGSVANIFFPVRVAGDNRTFTQNANGTFTSTLVAAGTLYGVYSDGTNIFLIHSTDHGTTFSAPVQVNNPTDPNLKINLLPWLATGPTPGTVAVVWYANSGPVPNDPADDPGLRWRMYYAQSFNATSTTPNFQYVVASDHVNHASNISLSGLVVNGPAPNRNLLDYFQINFDPVGAAVIGYTDDHNDFSGNTFETRQVSGPSIFAKVPGASATVPTPVEGSALAANPFATPGTLPTGTASSPQAMQPGPNGEQVTDFAEDTDTGLLASAPQASPVDILSVKYISQDTNQGEYITATMTVSDLSAIPPSTTYRMYFAANAPEVGDGTLASLAGPTGNKFSKGASDRADQFWVDAETTSGSTDATFNWGTTVRNSDGSTTDTVQTIAGAPPLRGFFNQTGRTISVRLPVNTLNAYLDTVHANDASFHIVAGSVLCGLRAHAFESTSGGLALEDYTRGGTEFKVGNPF